MTNEGARDRWRSHSFRARSWMRIAGAASLAVAMGSCRSAGSSQVRGGAGGGDVPSAGGDLGRGKAAGSSVSLAIRKAGRAEVAGREDYEPRWTMVVPQEGSTQFFVWVRLPEEELPFLSQQDGVVYARDRAVALDLVWRASPEARSLIERHPEAATALRVEQEVLCSGEVLGAVRRLSPEVLTLTVVDIDAA